MTRRLARLVDGEPEFQDRRVAIPVELAWALLGAKNVLVQKFLDELAEAKRYPERCSIHRIPLQQRFAR
jgi:hypothetical protein